MADLRIADAPEIDESEVQGGLKLPTGGFGNKAINMTTVANWVVKDKDLPSKGYVDDKFNQGNQGLVGHIANKNNPHEVTKEQVGLGNVDNTADADKPVSDATNAALNLKADKTSLDAKADKATTYTKVEVDDTINDIYQSLEDNFVANGAALPYDPQVTYNDGAIVNDSGTLKVVEGSNLELAVKADGVQVGDSTLDVFAEELAPIPQKLARENVSVWDFFTIEEKQEINRLYLAGTPQLFDAANQIQAFFDYIAANNVGTAYCSGTFYISKDLLLGGVNGSLTKQVIGNLVLNVFVPNTLVTMIKFQCGRYFNWSGRVETNGVGGVFYQNRTVMRGVQIGGEYASTSNNFDTIVVDGGFIDCGFISANLTSGTVVQSIRASRCGSGMVYGPDGIEDRSNRSLKATWSRVSDVTGTITQRTIISVEAMPPIDISTALLVRLGARKEQVHVVYSRDDVAKTLTIFPAVDSALTGGELVYFFGAAVYTTGADGGLVDIKKVTANNCSAVRWQNALYPGADGIILGEANAASLVIGSSPSSAHVGGSMAGIYTEGVEFDILRVTRAQLSYSIASNYALSQAKVYDVSNYRTLATNLITPQQAALTGVTLQVDGEFLSSENLPQNGSVTEIDITSKTRSTIVQRSNTKTFTILEPSVAMNNNFGFDHRDVVVFGSSANGLGIPTGVITFNAPDGWKINNLSTVSFSNFIRAPRFNLYADFINKNIVVTCSDTTTSASSTYDPPSIDAKQTVTTEITLQGVVVGQPVVAAFSRYDAGIKISAVVSAANTVTVIFENTTDAPIDLASGTLIVKPV